MNCQGSLSPKSFGVRMAEPGREPGSRAQTCINKGEGGGLSRSKQGLAQPQDAGEKEAGLAESLRQC